MGGSRWTSVWPPGAIRMVPTLTTMRIARAKSFTTKDTKVHEGNVTVCPAFFSENSASLAVKGQHLYPAVRMFFWQVEKSVRSSPHARFQCYQQLFGPRRELCALPAGISRRGFPVSARGVRPDRAACCRPHRTA